MDEQSQSANLQQPQGRYFLRSRGIIGGGLTTSLLVAGAAAEIHSCLLAGGLDAPWSAQAKVCLACIGILTSLVALWGRIDARERIRL